MLSAAFVLHLGFNLCWLRLVAKLSYKDGGTARIIDPQLVGLYF